MKVPSPPELGLPEKFDHWRDGQREAVDHGLNCQRRTIAQAMPVGAGKSLIYMTGAHLSQQRTVICTSTKGLQDQVMSDFGDKLHVACIKGKDNYRCNSRPGWTCGDGFSGRCLDKGTPNCSYSRAYFKAIAAPIVMTNFSFWMAVNRFGSGLGPVYRLVMDEAHAAFDELCNAIQIKVSTHEIEDMLEFGFPSIKDNMLEWKLWASGARSKSDAASKKLENKILGHRGEVKQQWVKDLQHLKNLTRKLGQLATVRPNDWVVDEWEYGFQFDPIRPSRYAESMLFLKTPKLNLLSATLREKTLGMIGIYDDYEFWDYPSPFPADGNPIYVVPTAAMDHRMSNGDLAIWLMRIDQIIQKRLDRRGVIHTVSYDRQRKILESSEWSKHMLVNSKDDITSLIVERYRKAGPPSILVSPSVSTGYDLPYDECRYQIIGKVPWPDGRSKVIKARSEYDTNYAPFVAMQQIMQMSGRGRRASDDWAENFLIDDHFANWFYNKNSWMAPNWWKEQLRFVKSLPEPRKIYER